MKTLFALIATFLLASPSGELLSADKHVFAMTVSKTTSFGHGCAVNGFTITNAHMVDPREVNDFSPPSKIRFRYQWQTGETGRGFSTLVSSQADLAVVALDSDPPNGYAPLAPRPFVGDMIYWTEYDFSKRKHIMQERERKGKIMRIVAGYVYLEENITRGASGGCAWNERGEVIGLMTFGITTEDMKSTAGVTGLWGKWFKDVDGK